MAESKNTFSITNVALMCFCFVMFGYGFASSLSEIIETFEAESWPTTQGVITSSEAKKCRNVKIPSVRYEYTVNGVAYTGNRITLSPTCSAKDWELVREKHIQVHYAPDKPHTSVLYVNGQYFWNWFTLVSSGVIVLLSIFFPRAMITRSSAHVPQPSKSEMERRPKADAAMEIEIRERLHK